MGSRMKKFNIMGAGGGGESLKTQFLGRAWGGARKYICQERGGGVFEGGVDTIMHLSAMSLAFKCVFSLMYKPHEHSYKVCLKSQTQM